MATAQKIMIVDDERVNLDFFDVMLTRLGYEVITAADGDSALDKIVEDRPDLVLLDNVLPGKTGWEITKLVKQSEEYADVADTPIVMFSAMDDVEDKVEGFELGIEDYITKPFNFSEVLARIQAVLRHRELTSQILRRERRLALVESLHESLVYFAKRLKEPINRIVDEARDLDTDDVESVSQWINGVMGEAKEALKTIEGLEVELADLQTKSNELQADEISLQELERRYRSHIELANTSQKG